jgi:hypothetical protein
MLIQEQQLTYWVANFYGYGSWKAKFWFVSYEEGGGDSPEEVADRLNYFSEKHPKSAGAELCDIRDLYRNVRFSFDGPKASLYKNLYEYRFDTNASLNTTWKNLISFEHSYLNKKIPGLLAYQTKEFAAQQKKNEALIRLFPLPSPHGHAWYYNWLDLPGVSFLRSRKLYLEYFYDERIKTILYNIKEYKPEVVLMYGMQNIIQLKNSVKAIFPDVNFKMVSAVKRQIPQHHRTQVGNTKLIITTQIPTLRHHRVETGFDWEEFGRTVASWQDSKVTG